MSNEFTEDPMQAPTADAADNAAAVVAGTAMDSETAASVHPVSPTPLGAIAKSKALVEAKPKSKASLRSMVDVPITLVMEVGRTNISVAQLMELVEGSIIDLRKVSVDSIEVRMNEKIIAQAEAISLQQRYGIRFTSLEKMATGEEEQTEGV
ncbi:MAG: FliM/FliN family flagellar motor switch protein [Pseudomonadales bacterium]|nr:FliM/FliN family flagellar motor switch protein [Pseudomonadales bacterium]